MDVYPDNVCSRYRIRLDNPIHLVDKPFWEVGLVELSYVHSLRTVQKGEAIEVLENYETLLSSISLPTTLLNSITSLKDSGIVHQNNLEMELKEGKVHIHFPKPKSTLYLPKVVARHLGFLPPPTYNEIMVKPVEPIPPLPFNERPPVQPLSKHAERWAEYEKSLPEFYERSKAHQQKQSVYEEQLTSYLKQTLVFNSLVTAKAAQERDDQKDENMHTIIKKSDGKWTSVAPYFISKIPIQSYSFALTIELRTWPEVLHTLTLREGHYATAESLLKELDRISEPVKNDLRWEYLSSKNRFQVSSNNHAIRFHRTLADVLGFQNIVLNADLVYEAPYRPDLLRGTYHMYVYTDLCENTQVGNVQVPLLRTIPLQDVSYGQVKSYTFTNLIYVPLAKRHFDTIEVELRDDTGELLPLEEGKTVLVLHIRPRQV